MPSYSISDIPGARLLLLGTVAALAFGYLTEPAAKAQRAPITWVVTVDVTKPNPSAGPEVPTYSILPAPASTATCPTSSTPSTVLGDVLVCPGDTVLWSANTARGHGAITVYEWDGVLHNGSASPHWFHGNVGDKIGGSTTPAHPQTGPHEYVVAVYDPDANPPKLFVDDPKIIVGSGNGNLANPAAELIQIQQSAQQLSDQLVRVLKDDPKAQEEAKVALRQIIDDVDRLQRIPQLK